MKNIFIVDDSDVNLIMAEKALADYFNVFTLPSAEAMFEFLNDVVPELILLDIKMPKINGLDALKMLKTESVFGNIPVIFLTSKDDPDTKARGFELGAIDFIAKPFSCEVLLNSINKALSYS
ncbi:MAG: response regulator [Oscillospiraceae bacterium]|nr:response regulator [Oscillospiraceae bacterium]